MPARAIRSLFKGSGGMLPRKIWKPILSNMHFWTFCSFLPEENGQKSRHVQTFLHCDETWRKKLYIRPSMLFLHLLVLIRIWSFQVGREKDLASRWGFGRVGKAQNFWFGCPLQHSLVTEEHAHPLNLDLHVHASSSRLALGSLYKWRRVLYTLCLTRVCLGLGRLVEVRPHNITLPIGEANRCSKVRAQTSPGFFTTRL